MATFFRAVVMLVVLVGLPAAWVYYGPLPPAAMGVVERTLASARVSLGWESTPAARAWQDDSSGTAPQFEASLASAPAASRQSSNSRGVLPTLPTRPSPANQLSARQAPVMQDAQFSLASATTPMPSPSAPLEVNAELARQLEPHLSLLRSQGAAEYTLENWGGEGRFYRFRCAIAWGESQDHTRQFEAIDSDPLRAVYQVVGEVTSWQNARGTQDAPRWQ